MRSSSSGTASLLAPVVPQASMPTTVFRASDAARDALDRTLALLRRHLTNEGDQP
jgi:hypothetical protein